MKTIEVDEELYRYIASQTQNIGESASDILRRLLMTSPSSVEEIKLSSLARQKNGTSLSFSSNQVTTGNSCQNVAKLQSVPVMAKLEPMHMMQHMLNSKEFIQETRAIGRFMMLLSHLYQIDDRAFSDAAELKGRKRIYFAKNQDVLLASGKTTKPKPIPNSPYWVITNTNTGRKQQIVQQLMEKMGFQSEFIERVISTI